jgi:hypothetical protein
VDPEFVPIAAYRDVLDAELAVSTLAAAGIDAQLVDENTVGVAWTCSVAVGGVKVMVPKPEVDAARELLESDQCSELDEVLGPGDESERPGSARDAAHQNRRRTSSRGPRRRQPFSRVYP